METRTFIYLLIALLIGGGAGYYIAEGDCEETVNLAFDHSDFYSSLMMDKIPVSDAQPEIANYYKYATDSLKPINPYAVLISKSDLLSLTYALAGEGINGARFYFASPDKYSTYNKLIFIPTVDGVDQPIELADGSPGAFQVTAKPGMRGTDVCPKCCDKASPLSP